MLFCCKLWLNGAKNYACGEKVTNIRYANGWYHDIKRVLLRFGRINPICWNKYINHYRTVLNVEMSGPNAWTYMSQSFLGRALHCTVKRRIWGGVDGGGGGQRVTRDRGGGEQRESAGVRSKTGEVSQLLRVDCIDPNRLSCGARRTPLTYPPYPTPPCPSRHIDPPSEE